MWRIGLRIINRVLTWLWVLLMLWVIVYTLRQVLDAQRV
jgi:hypothetical protein